MVASQRQDRRLAKVSPTLQIMINVAEKASRKLVRDFGEVENLQVSRKGPADFVSKADIQAEKTLRAELLEARPNIGFLSEELGVLEVEKQQARWIMDPLDGTTNFLHGMPHWCISIALEEKGVLTAAVIYDPVKDEVFYGEKGQGAFVNSKRLRVSARNDLSTCLFVTGIPFKGCDHAEETMEDIKAVAAVSSGIRRTGSAALDLAYVAAGRFDAYWERGLAPWDIAAGILLIREAGGIITTIDGKDMFLESPTILASNQEVHGPIMKLLK